MSEEIITSVAKKSLTSTCLQLAIDKWLMGKFIFSSHLIVRGLTGSFEVAAPVSKARHLFLCLRLLSSFSSDFNTMNQVHNCISLLKLEITANYQAFFHQDETFYH